MREKRTFSDVLLLSVIRHRSICSTLISQIGRQFAISFLFRVSSTFSSLLFRFCSEFLLHSINLYSAVYAVYALYNVGPFWNKTGKINR